MAKVTEYLCDMEIDQFFIDKMMSCSSQDSYVLALRETTEHHLDQIVPSIEEILLTKCKVPTAQEIQTFYALSATTPGNIAARQQFIEKDMAAHDCERNALDDIRKTAFRRKMDDLKKRWRTGRKVSVQASGLPAPR